MVNVARDAPKSASVRAMVDDNELYNYEEFTYETDNGGILTVANPSSATEAAAGKWKYDGVNFLGANTTDGSFVSAGTTAYYDTAFYD